MIGYSKHLCVSFCLVYELQACTLPCVYYIPAKYVVSPPRFIIYKCLIDYVRPYEGCQESIQPFEYLENRSCGRDVTWQPV